MAGIPTSPTVVFLEKDNSAYPANIDSSVVGLVGYATKGPTNEATLVTSQENLLRIFGNPSEDIPGQGLEGALEILETTNQLRFVRAIPGDASSAYADIQFGVCPAIKFATSGFGTVSGLYFKATVKDSDGTTLITEKEFSIPSGTKSTTDGQAAALASIIGDGTVKTDPLYVAYNESSKGFGYLVAPYAGIDAYISLSAYSNAAFTTPVSALKPLYLSSGDEVGTFASSYEQRGLDIHVSSLFYRVQAKYKGSGYNLTTDSSTGETLGLNVEANAGGGLSNEVTINSDGIAAETFRVSLLDDSTFVENVITVGVDNATSDYVIGELYWSGEALGDITPLADPTVKVKELATGEMVASSVMTLTYHPATVVEVSANPRFVKFKDKTTSLANGLDGTMITQAGVINTSSIIGIPGDKTGMYALDDDLLNISLAAIPGITSQNVQNALITLAETSQNFLAVVSPPIATNDAEEAVDWMNGRSQSRTAAINSSWAAIYWPWVQVFDVFAAKDRWYDPAIFAIRQMTFTDNVAETWFAPAGFRRGRLTKPTATEVSLNQGDRDALYVTNINPIVNFAPEGITIFGQKTAQRLATSLDRVNVRRLMIYLRKVLLQAGRIELFEPNDEFTWDSVRTAATNVLADIQMRRGITDFQVVCDATVNTPLRVDRNELWCKILLKPTKTAEWVIFEVNLTNQSAKFSG
jgi:phage tail sheath protein FI